MTIVSVVGMVFLGLLTGAATEANVGPDGNTRVVVARPFGRAIGGAVTVVAVLALAVPLLAEFSLEASRYAVGRGELRSAVVDAARARAIEPWAASPYLQLALVAERGGDLRSGLGWIGSALHRDPTDWELWLGFRHASRRRAGRIGAARASLAQARRLNPLSPTLGGLG